MVSTAYTVKQYKKYEKKWKEELKTLNKQNKMVYSITKKFSSRHEIKNINNIRSKASKKGCHYSNGSPSDYLDSYSSLASDSSQNTYRRPSGRN